MECKNENNFVIVLTKLGTLRCFGPYTYEEFQNQKYKFPETVYVYKYFDTMENAKKYLKK